MTKFIQQTQTDRNWSWIYHINFNFVSSNILVSCKLEGFLSTMGNGPVRSSHLPVNQPSKKKKEVFLFRSEWALHAPAPLPPLPPPVPLLVQQTQTDCNWHGLTSHKIGRQIPAQPNFHTLYKSDQCSSKHELFSDFLVSYKTLVH